MTAAPPRARLVALTPADLADRLGEALDVYVAAMGYPRGAVRQRRGLWLEHTRRTGWRCRAWLDPAGALIGIAYGYSGGPGQWWFDEVRRGLAARGMARDPAQPNWLGDYFELTELHVRPDAQGHGLGEQLLRSLVADVEHTFVLLSTPEHAPMPPSRAWRLYRRLGFADVLRDHRFTGDNRLFAVLGRRLPLPDRAAPDTPERHPGGGATPMAR